MFLLCAAVVVSNGGCSERTSTTKAIPSLSEQLYPVTFSMTRAELVEKLPTDKTSNWLLLTSPASLDPMETATLPSGMRITVAFNESDDSIKVIHIGDEWFILPDGLSMRSTARAIRLLRPRSQFLCYHGYASVIEVADGIRIAFFPWTESDPEPTSTPAWIEIYPEALQQPESAKASSPIE